ncbi:hydantoinase/oxoprolinase family protein [Nocardioides endophyticus]|uniref:Hydantoinase/oxoprolinase family protein n=1 Tax=Nocardioides endophyticus TaxID=1353775 RepID=A0ABP8YYA1_9ACTN
MSQRRNAGNRVGIDVGGTFTDAVMLDPDNGLSVTKVPTTPPQFARGVLAALSAIAERTQVPVEAIQYLSHGSTVATNAIVTDQLARTGLLTTKGFRDVLEIGTQQRATLYDLGESRKPPVSPRELRLEVDERVGPDGDVVRPLMVEDVAQAAQRFRDEGVEAVAIAFLFSFANAAHERQARDLLLELLPGVPVSISSEVSPEFREYQRTSTTVLNASLLPLVGGYLEEVVEGVEQREVPATLLMMRSNGGLAPASDAAKLPVSLVASGPAAGVMGVATVARHVGVKNLLTFDMGGTTADVALVLDGQPQLNFRGDAGGHPINLPQMDILSVGAGGGSIASVDGFGALRVGPESAGADPGPAGYGKGGDRPTITDAHLVLGLLPTGRVLGDSVRLDVAAASAAIEEHVARPLGIGVYEAAEGIMRVANAKMATALRVASVSRGHDPRELTLVAFGGAGPMHAAALADELDMTTVLIPPAPGAACALGLLLSDVQYDITQPWTKRDRSLRADLVGPGLETVKKEGERRLQEAGFADEASRVELSVDIRYLGQAYELSIPVTEGVDDDAMLAVTERFHSVHKDTYGHDLRHLDLEVVNLRGRAIGPVANSVSQLARVASAAPTAEMGTRDIGGVGQRLPHRILSRAAIASDKPESGPLVLQEDDTTIHVPPGWTASRGEFETVILTKEEVAR